MTTTEALQTLQEEFKRTMDQTKAAQGCVQQLRGAKKDADVIKRRQELLTNLKTMETFLAQLQEHMHEKRASLEEALNQKEESADIENQDSQQKDAEKRDYKPPGILETRNLNPEQQEALYELKSSRMGAMQAQNQALKKELHLNMRKRHLLQARYAQTQGYSGSETLRAAHALEAKLRGATLKMKGLEDELKKSQQMALRYRELYEESQRQNEAEHAHSLQKQGAPRSKSAPKPVKPAPLKEQSFIGPNTNINDVVRKNECLLEENAVNKQEIQRLKRDNAELILIAKTSASDRHSIFAQLGTSESARHDLQKRYERLKNENSQLSRSFTKQTADWIEYKKRQQHYESHGRWGDIYPVAPHGGKERFKEHYQKDNTSLPRQMFPVESYGGTSTA